MALTPSEPPSGGGPLLDSAPAAADEPAEPQDSGDLTQVKRSFIWLLVMAIFGVYVAFVTPIAISLAVRVEQLAPGHEEYLGYITGAGGLAALLTAPVCGMLSDRTRSRFGRRSPFLLAGTAVGAVALVVMAAAPDIPVLGLGWVLAQMGWQTVVSLLIALQADRLPESQRGKVSGLSGVVQQLAPIAGALMAGGLTGNNFLLFLVPGVFGVVAVLLFVCLVREADSRGAAATDEPLSLKSLARTYVFDPRRSPEFAWNWLGKFLFMFAVTFNTTFMAFYLADRLGVTVKEVSGAIALLAGGGVVATMIGAIGGGFLSDRLRRRRIFVLAGGCLFAFGAVVMALAPGLTLIVVGASVSNLGLGLFAAVDQAVMLDVLPARETDAGRFTAIYAFSTSLPQGLAPFVAPVFLGIGATGGHKDFTFLYLLAAACSLLGGLAVALRVKSVR